MDNKLGVFKVDKNTDKLNHLLLPYIELLGLYIRANTSYCIEISFINNDYGRFFSNR